MSSHVTLKAIIDTRCAQIVCCLQLLETGSPLKNVNMSSPKRRRLDDDNYMRSGFSSESQGFSHRFLSDVNAEVTTEIALKEQLSDTLESRIAWALMLQDSLKKGVFCLFFFQHGSSSKY